MTTWAVRSVLLLTLVAGAVGVQRGLDRHPGPAAVTNGVAPGVFAVIVPGHARACEPSVPPPPGVRTAQLTIGTYGAPGVRVHTSIPGAGAGPSMRLQREGAVNVPIPPAGAGPAARLCLVNEASTRIALGGAVVPRRDGAEVAGHRAPGVFSVAYIVPAPDRWRDRASRIIDRVGYAKGLVGGSATGAAVIVLVLAAVAFALLAGARWLRS